MNDIWFEPLFSRDDYDSLLETLGLDPDNGAPSGPMLAVVVDRQAARLVMASHAFFGVFGVHGSEALSRRMLGGADPGARRLVDLVRSLPLDGAPRLERLRFQIGPGSEVITFLCRRTRLASGVPVFVAAALGVRPGLLVPVPDISREPAAHRTGAAISAEQTTGFDGHMSIEAIQATLNAKWPGSRRLRFLWQTDAEAVCQQLSHPLDQVVGEANGNLVGKNLHEVAPRLDPSGRLAEALASRANWSGIEVEWPIADAPGGVIVALGAVATTDRERVFHGFRGYGVIHLDKVVARQPARLVPSARASDAQSNVVPFPTQKGFSAEDLLAFDALGVALRDHAGLVAEEPKPADEPAPDLAAEVAADVAPDVAADTPVEIDDQAVAPTTISTSVPSEPPPGESTTPVPAPTAPRGGDAAGNGFALLDRLALGLLVSRDNVPIFANRRLLDMLGFADEDALHAVGGLRHLFGGEPADTASGEAVGVRDRDGAVIPTAGRLQRIHWDGLPATLLTLQPLPDQQPAEDLEAEHEAAIETMARQHADDRRRDDIELRHLRAILETATDGVAVIDDRGDVLSLNRSGEALFGRDRGEVIGKPFIDLFPQDTQALAKDYLDGLATSATRSLLNDGRELMVKAPQGGAIPVFMTLGRLDRVASAAEGLPAGADDRLCALFRDLTHWKKVEHELEAAKHDAEAASAAKTDFLAKISHEVRTPLNAIIGFAEVILEERFGPVGNERYKDYLRDIHTSGTHVMSLVNDLLDLSKIEAGRMELSATPIDANKVITECVSLMQPQASRERVIMRLSLAPTLPLIKADERSVRQIVLNLLSNAVKFNEPGGQVIVATAAPEDGKVVIRVRDTGAGMSEADIAAALEPFRQVSTRSTTEGTGLGLPLTKALVEANEATFMIRSKLDQGTLIEVAFPPARVLARQR